ncbi:MAG: alginate export family protein [Oxalobacteraceae bacterium]|nr:MAG: alginate export family protein [Oxalobacteraceae bacterium]
MTTLRYAIAATCLWASPASAESGPLERILGAPDELTVAASVRARVESIEGQFRPGRAPSDSMLSLKSTLAAEYDAGKVRVGGELWDARTYGQDALSSAGTTEINALELVQAYVRVELDDRMVGSTVTAGRFTLDIGSRRFVSRQAFRNTTNAYTGVHVDWHGTTGSRLQFLWSMPHIRLPEDAAGIRDDKVAWDRESTDLQLAAAHLTVPRVLGGVAEVYGFWLGERDSPDRLTRNRRLYTPGARLFRKPAKGQWDHDLEGAYQFGKIRQTSLAADRTDLDVSAWFAHGELGYTVSGRWVTRISLHFDAASGDAGRPGRFGRFDTLYGARRFEFGPTSLFGALGRANIVSPGLRADIAPSKRLDGFAMVRPTWAENARDAFTATGVRDSRAASGSYAGTQLEGRVRYWLVPSRVRLDGGAAYIFKGRLLNEAPNAPRTGDSAYGYFDITFSF